MLSLASGNDSRKVMADVKGVFAEDCRGERHFWECGEYSYYCRKCGVLSKL